MAAGRLRLRRPTPFLSNLLFHITYLITILARQSINADVSLAGKLLQSPELGESWDTAAVRTNQGSVFCYLDYRPSACSFRSDTTLPPNINHAHNNSSDVLSADSGEARWNRAQMKKKKCRGNRIDLGKPNLCIATSDMFPYGVLRNIVIRWHDTARCVILTNPVGWQTWCRKENLELVSIPNMAAAGDYHLLPPWIIPSAYDWQWCGDMSMTLRVYERSIKFVLIVPHEYWFSKPSRERVWQVNKSHSFMLATRNMSQRGCHFTKNGESPSGNVCLLVCLPAYKLPLRDLRPCLNVCHPPTPRRQGRTGLGNRGFAGMTGGLSDLRRYVQGVLTSGLCVLCGLERETSSARREIQLLQPNGWYKDPHKGPSTPPALSFGNDERERVFVLVANRTGFIPSRVTGISQVGIVPDDAVGRRVFSGISCFPRPLIPAPLHIHSITFIGSQDLTFKSCPILFPHTSNPNCGLRSPRHPLASQPASLVEEDCRLFKLVGAYLYTRKCGTKYQGGAIKYKECTEHARRTGSSECCHEGAHDGLASAECREPELSSSGWQDSLFGKKMEHTHNFLSRRDDTCVKFEARLQSCHTADEALVREAVPAV
ncbi:hypothetical protein PR048_009065 [Dryococelus australis]|uniref:Uncharacterized protein n=1 Tax=Dryococelus australis TaxID=614101 RepID=A0ABQ9HZM9_9NEOP|nr:hypothetical protein PR048_009065 [Dryococelus australis]